jgi:hypothetical protein
VRLFMMLLLPLQHPLRTGSGFGDGDDPRPLLLLLFARRDRPHPVRQVRDVLVAALRAELVQGRLQPPQVVPVEAARPLAAVDVLGELLRVLRADELLVVGGADVYQRLDGLAAVLFLR